MSEKRGGEPGNEARYFTYHLTVKVKLKIMEGANLYALSASR